MLQSDVAGDFGSANDSTFCIPYGRDGQRNRNKTSILALTDCFKMGDPLAAPQPCDEIGLFINPVFREDDRNGAANRFLCTVAEEVLGAAILAQDDTVQVLRDNCIFRPFHDRCQVLSDALRTFHARCSLLGLREHISRFQCILSTFTIASLSFGIR